jgi:hypothetical protein
MFKHRRVRVAALAIATAIAVPAVSLIATSSAQAGGGEAKYPGEVIAKTLAVRKHATTYGKRIGTLKKGNVVSIFCKVEAVPVDGNRIWYALKGGGNVAARYVKTSARRRSGAAVAGGTRARPRRSRRLTCARVRAATPSSWDRSSMARPSRSSAR